LVFQGVAVKTNSQIQMIVATAVCASVLTAFWSGLLFRTGALAATTGAAKHAQTTPAVQGRKIAIAQSSKLKQSPAGSGAGLGSLTPDEKVNINVYKVANKAVAYIATVTPKVDYFNRVIPSEGEGSGCILTSDGYILTNNHVVEGAHTVRVTLSDGTNFPAEITGTDPEFDVAVIKIDPGKKVLTVMQLGDSSKLEVGMRTFAIGNPFGFERTMTSGIVSATDRTATTAAGRVIRGVVQTDAAINPGNSGGPLLNSRAEMIGLTTAIYTKSQQWGGLGFAIPINTVKRIFPQLIANHKVIRPDLGITKMQAASGGLQVVSVDPNGPAATAGIVGWKVNVTQNGPFTMTQVDPAAADVIMQIDSAKTATMDDLLEYLETKSAGQVVTLTIRRQGKLLKVPVKLTSNAGPTG
jgi:S1-C subfamily serine protease